MVEIEYVNLRTAAIAACSPTRPTTNELCVLSASYMYKHDCGFIAVGKDVPWEQLTESGVVDESSEGAFALTGMGIAKCRMISCCQSCAVQHL